ncbi:DUF72 domain-containing protein [Pseudomonas sp.]|uniref:DUF72 domain-containing protein n=1 Tax=Pseudomonas sp. TaxID=306 RepID=UPI0028A6A86B|nr:DUF72 domain-containing protein [Pseudomonas sp.]
MNQHNPVWLGTAGWSLPREQWPAFGREGTHLARYATRLPAVEINSSFYRPHRPATYARWAGSVPDGFRFCVKIPKVISHERRLVDCGDPLARFLDECAHLGDTLGCLLLQLPPSLVYEPPLAAAFIEALRARHEGLVAIEPRHPSWLAAEPLLRDARIARVAADPAPFAGADAPGGWVGMRYYRLHGSPRTYYSSYPDDWLDRLATRLAEEPADTPTWCIFDNTASGAATANALGLQQRLG